MTFLSPGFLVAGGLAAIAVVALHLLTTRRPPARLLPTARFVPEAELRAVSRASRPTDLLLLALRLLAVAAAALAFARPVFNRPGPATRNVVALEWTTAVADLDAARAQARSAVGEGGALVLFDTAARVVPVDALDTLGAPRVRQASWSPMFWAARDAARGIARGADSLRLRVYGVSRHAAGDAATEGIRRAWPGGLEFTELPVRRDSTRGARAELRSPDGNDPLAPALSAWESRRGTHPLRAMRAAPAAADSAWAASTPQAVLVHWLDAGGIAPAADGVLAFGERPASLVAHLVRREPAAGRVIARWRDGSIAATEQPLGQGCVKSIGIAVPTQGDVTLRAPFAAFVDALFEPCGGELGAAMPESTLTWLRGPEGLAAARPFQLGAGAEDSPLAPWLLAIAAAALLVEQRLRRRPREVA